MSVIVLFPSLLEIIPLQHLFDEEGRGNDKAEDVCRSLKSLPELLRTHLHHRRVAPVENTCLWALIQFP